MESLAGLRIFVRVVSAGSFSAAGRQLDLAPSSVSRRINELEAELGARLFHRTTRKLSLTEAGQLYNDRAVRILSDVDEAKLARSELGSPTGILRLTVASGIGREMVATAIPAFLQEYPGVRIVMSMTDSLVDLVDEQIDVAIRVGRLRDSNLRATKIGESRRVVSASPEYLERSGTPRTPADLQHHNCVTWRNHPGKNLWRFRGSEGDCNVQVTGTLFAQSADALAAAAVAGLGLVLLPDWNIGIELRHQQLKVVLKDYAAVPQVSPIWAVHDHLRYVPPKVREFVRFLSTSFKGSRVAQ